MSEKSLIKEVYFHGLLPREDLKEFLQRTGEFLVRVSEPMPGLPRKHILSVYVDENLPEPIVHFIINKNSNNRFFIDGYSFESIQQLVVHYLDRPESVSKQVECRLKFPVGRKSWELDHADVECTKRLGSGAFGEVHKGRLKRLGKLVDVAIKVISQSKLEAMTKAQIAGFMQEGRLMRMFDHVNVVALYGVAAITEPLMLVMELAREGALDSYLQKTTVSEAVKEEMCLQAAQGVSYVHAKGIIHRDIAARNCLYGDGKVKISDFGMSRVASSYKVDPDTRVPLKWLAPETMRSHVYTQKTDVFSYGILCWEIYHNGKEPYEKLTAAEVNKKVITGGRMDFTEPIKRDIKEFIVVCKEMTNIINPSGQSPYVVVKPKHRPSSTHHKPHSKRRRSTAAGKEKRSISKTASKSSGGSAEIEEDEDQEPESSGGVKEEKHKNHKESAKMKRKSKVSRDRPTEDNKPKETRSRPSRNRVEESTKKKKPPPPPSSSD